MSFQSTFKYSMNFFTSSAQSNGTTTFVRMTFGRQTSIQTDTFDPLLDIFVGQMSWLCWPNGFWPKDMEPKARL